MDKADKEYLEALGLGQDTELHDPEAWEKYPKLMKGFTQRQVGGKYKAEPWVLTLKRGIRCVVWTVRDNTLKHTLTGACGFLDDVYSTIEEVLSSPNPPWVPMPGKDPQLKASKPLIP